MLNPSGHKRKSNISRLKGNAVDLLLRSKVLAKMGISFGGKRDTFDVLGYTKNLTYQHYHARYLRDNIAARIVNAPAHATWSNPPKLVPRKNNKTAGVDFVKAWEDLQEEHQIFWNLSRADTLSGIGRYAVLLIGIKGQSKTDLPVARTNLTAKDILFFSPFSEDMAQIDSLDSDPSSARFGKPKTYSIMTGKDVANQRSITLKTDHSRVVHLAEGLLQDDVFGKPRLESVYNLFDDLVKVVGGSAEFFWRVADRGLQADIDPELELDKDEEKALSKEMEEYYHGLRRFIQTRGVTMKNLGNDTADPRGPFQGIISLISGTTKIPQRILLGSERGQLASSQDRTSWNELIFERNVIYAGPQVLRPLILRLQNWGVLPATDFDIEWPILQPLTEEERSVIAVRVASGVLNLAKSRNLGGTALSEQEYREHFLGLKGKASPPDELALTAGKPDPVEKEEGKEEEGKDEGDDKKEDNKNPEEN